MKIRKQNDYIFVKFLLPQYFTNITKLKHIDGLHYKRAAR